MEFKELELLAIDLAKEAHKNQIYDNKSYITHLNHVVINIHKYFNCLNSLLVSKHDIILAGWLHDIIEDTDVTSSQLEDSFGKLVVDLILLVTNDSTLLNREEKLRNLAKNINSSSLRKEAVFLKLMDRISNTENKAKIKMYSKEFNLFKSLLYKKEDNLDIIWDYLESISKL